MPEDVKISLLIVEDELATLELYRNMIKMAFPQIIVNTADNKYGALSLYKQFKHNIVVSDLRVPNKEDGIAIAREVCAENPDAQVFFVTAESHVDWDSLKPHINHLCLKDIIRKPLDFQYLIDKIAEAIDTITTGRVKRAEV